MRWRYRKCIQPRGLKLAGCWDRCSSVTDTVRYLSSMQALELVVNTHSRYRAGTVVVSDIVSKYLGN